MSKVSSMGRWATAAAFGVALGAGTLAARADDSSAAKASSAASKSADEANRAADEAAEAAQKAGRKTSDTAADAVDKTRDTASEAADKARDTSTRASEKADDTMITGKIKGGLATKGSEAAGIDVDSRDGVVTLTGTVSSESTRDAAVKAAKETKGVTIVNDEIDVRPHGSK